MKSFAVRIAGRWYGPVIAALVLGLLSAPFAALSILDSSWVRYLGRDVATVEFGESLAMALLAVTAAALVGGSLGGMLVRARPVLGVFIALLVAWPVAIATLPLLPALAGWPYRTDVCIDVCNPGISGEAPLSGLYTYAGTLVWSILGPLEIAGILALIAIVLARTHRRALATTLAIATFVSLNFWSIGWYGAPYAAIALIVGAIVWVAPHLVSGSGPRRETVPD